MTLPFSMGLSALRHDGVEARAAAVKRLPLPSIDEIRLAMRLDAQSRARAESDAEEAAQEAEEERV